MKLSIVIVNYNVKYFLEQALLSVRRALQNVDAEIWVVDNNSTDGSVKMLQQKFPDVKLISNKDNVGFSKANNQAIAKANGEYILLLNPDTVLQEDTLQKCVDFMDAHPDAGGLGVKMVDGSGIYLPESKRGFPSPWVAFCKAFGLTKFFPRSKKFAGYYLGHLHENETHEVDVLAGAFMMLRKTTLDKIGWLDETFFMYGEDIDLSYRVVQAGFKNYYLADTRIIHYKGESTKKGSLNYVRMFYNAMIIFARKHFTGSKSAAFVTLIQLAIYVRGAFTVVRHITKALALPLLDALLIYGGMMLIKNFWELSVKADEGTKYPLTYTLVVVPAYIVVWILSVYLNGGYDKPLKLTRLIRGLAVGTLVIAAVYGFLDETLRFSRAMILLGFGWSVLVLGALRLVRHFILYKNFDIEGSTEKRCIIVGNQTETQRVEGLLSRSGARVNVIGFIPVTDNANSERALGTLDELEDLVNTYNVDELIFCSNDLLANRIIDWMTSLGSRVEYKMVPPESMSIIGSPSRDLPGELYTIDIRLNIDQPFQKRNKRMLDVGLSFLFIALFLPLLPFVKRPAGFFKNIFSVLFGKKTWVGFAHQVLSDDAHVHLPRLRDGVLSPLDQLQKQVTDVGTIHRLNVLYARDYNVYKDLAVIGKGYKNLGA